MSTPSRGEVKLRTVPVRDALNGCLPLNRVLRQDLRVRQTHRSGVKWLLEDPERKRPARSRAYLCDLCASAVNSVAQNTRSQQWMELAESAMIAPMLQ